jgi:hypothetical protein
MLLTVSSLCSPHGKVTGDKVGPHGDLLDEFPYVGRPHKLRNESAEENDRKTKPQPER